MKLSVVIDQMRRRTSSVQMGPMRRCSGLKIEEETV